LVTRCTKRSLGQAVGFIGARRLDLDGIAAAYGVRFSFVGGEPTGHAGNEQTLLVEPRTPELVKVEFCVLKSCEPLEAHLVTLDERILLASALSVLVAIVGAVLLARNLARPIEELAVQAREVVRGEPRPVQARGGKELEALEQAF